MKKVCKIILVVFLIWMAYPFFSEYVFKTSEANIEYNEEKIYSIENRIDTKNKQYSNYNNLNDDEKLIFNMLYNRSYEILEGKETSTTMTLATIDFDVYGIDSAKIYKAFRHDYPYLAWWLDGGTYNLKRSTNYVTLDFELNEAFRKDKNVSNELSESVIKKAQQAYSKAEEIASMEFENQNERINYFKNYILDNVSYDDETRKQLEEECSTLNEDNYLAQNFVNVFDDNKNTNVVCSGYASAFQLLCDLSGVQNMYYTTGMTEENHAWNIYYNGSDKYLIDLTNTDDGLIGQDGSLYFAQIDNATEYSVKTFSKTVYYFEDTYTN